MKEELVKKDVERFRFATKSGFGVPTAKKKTKPSDESEGFVQTTPKSRRQRLEEYLLFLALQSPAPAFREHLLELSQYELSTPGAPAVMKLLQAQPALAKLEQLAKELPDDLQQAVFEWSSHPEYQQMLPSITIETEWQRTFPELQEMVVRDRIEKINLELQRLESSALTAIEEAKQIELLQEIVALQKQLGSKIAAKEAL